MLSVPFCALPTVLLYCGVHRLIVVCLHAGTELVLVPVYVPPGHRVHQSQGGLHRLAAHTHRHQRRYGPAVEADYLRGGDREQTEHSNG